jgi:transcriptional regulator with XRE-family HTH domain
MASKPRKVRLDELTPEQRAKVEDVRTRFRAPTQRAEEEQLRARYTDRPTRDELIARGDIDPDRIMTGGAFFALLDALARLRQERQARGLSLADVAERSGIDPATLSRLDGGKNPNPTYETLSRFAEAVGLRLTLGLVDPGVPGAGEEWTPEEQQAVQLMRKIGVPEARRRLLMVPDETPGAGRGRRNAAEHPG